MNLLDDSPVVPGDARQAWQNTNQARQILNDAEDDLRDWQPDLEEISSRANLDSGLMPNSSGHQYTGTEGSLAENDSVVTDHVTPTNHNQDGSRVSSGASVTTGAPSFAVGSDPRTVTA